MPLVVVNVDVGLISSWNISASRIYKWTICLNRLSLSISRSYGRPLRPYSLLDEEKKPSW